ncbi:helix-turn-helix transcriptional regulator [Herbaspirillum sp. AP02]|uniref:AraC family transcriptional regulator n=1 Tax=unclassified Herbaspirillum TaxID=2624150 RepID=UPI0015D9FCFC|nr:MULTISPECIES: helix-turn-helix transcriptional regulator [unclassified Herbaspirillum]MBG7622064.1 helix-turn-helix transcriptional regulator [Herbaspirillum sp. AP02]NZD70007.1 helix-turn-helix transcriptional regulator [Herbaspirillum sp. AP21]
MSNKRLDHLLLAPPTLMQLPRPIYVRAQAMAAGAHFAEHQHDWVQFLYATNGTLRVTLPSGSFTVPSRFAVWIPAGMRHQVSAQNEVSFRSLYLATAAVQNGTDDRSRVVEVTALARELILAAARLPSEYDEQGRAGRLLATLVDELVDLQETDMYLPLPDDARLKVVCEALMRDPADDRDIDAWAGRIHVSGKTLARLFERETSMSFRQWRQRLRLCRGLELMAGGHSVTKVALEVGYSTSSAFIAAFKEQFGKAPREFMQEASP